MFQTKAGKRCEPEIMVPVTCDVSELEVTKKITDRDGVGLLIRMSVEKGRAARPDLKIGICGEQGGDPASVEFCYETGMTYVSCSPFRVPIARLAAAQAAIKADRKKR